METLTHHQIRPSDLDSPGHLSHIKAIELFEQGRHDWSMRHSIKNTGNWLPVVTRADVRYQHEIFLTEIIIATELKDIRYYSIEFAQHILIPGLDQAAVKANIWISFIDQVSRHPLRVQCTNFLNPVTQAS